MRPGDRIVAINCNKYSCAMSAQMHYHTHMANCSSPVRHRYTPGVTAEGAIYAKHLGKQSQNHCRCRPDDMREADEALAGDHVHVEDRKRHIVDQTALK